LDALGSQVFMTASTVRILFHLKANGKGNSKCVAGFTERTIFTKK
jgi:hypothetical protein